MSKSRSPNYPSLDLGAAIEAMRPVFDEEHRNKMSRDTLARHLGYNSLNGRALGKIGAVRAYGLVEGTGDAIRVSDDTITILEAPKDAPDRAEALTRRAYHSTLFQQIAAEYPNEPPSETNLRFWLVKKDFTPEAAGKAAAIYLSTIKLVASPARDYNPLETQEDDELEADAHQGHGGQSTENGRRKVPPPASPPQGARREVITLDEGDVVITFPENLSADSFGDLKDHLDLFVKKMQRRAQSIKN